MSTTKPKSGPELAAEYLAEQARPVHVKVIAAEVVKRDKARKPADRVFRGKTPEQTIAAQINVSAAKPDGVFERTQPGVFALRAFTAAQKKKAPVLPDGFTPRGGGSSAPAPAAPKKTSAKAKKSAGSTAKPKGGSGEIDAQAAAHTQVLTEPVGAAA